MRWADAKARLARALELEALGHFADEAALWTEVLPPGLPAWTFVSMAIGARAASMRLQAHDLRFRWSWDEILASVADVSASERTGCAAQVSERFAVRPRRKVEVPIVVARFRWASGAWLAFSTPDEAPPELLGISLPPDLPMWREVSEAEGWPVMPRDDELVRPHTGELAGVRCVIHAESLERCGCPSMWAVLHPFEVATGTEPEDWPL